MPRFKLHWKIGQGHFFYGISKPSLFVAREKVNLKRGVDMRKLGILGAALWIIFTGTALGTGTESWITTPSGQVHVMDWSDASLAKTAEVVILLSGPTDNWNSDSAWFARLGPKLARTHRTIAIDRAGLVGAKADAVLGYVPFAADLDAVLQKLEIKACTVIAFASSNMTLHTYFARQQDSVISRVIMIDPDVLTAFSIGRYSKDALPMKENLEKYLAFIGEGKYADRALEKNTAEMAHLKELAGQDADTDWDYVEKMFAARLEIQNLQNLIAEIARYDEDLNRAKDIPFPSQIPLTIIDTDFEQGYINQSQDADAIAGLKAWREDAATYYRKLTDASVKGVLVTLPTKEHLLPFSDPDLLLKLIRSE